MRSGVELAFANKKFKKLSILKAEFGKEHETVTFDGIKMHCFEQNNAGESKFSY